MDEQLKQRLLGATIIVGLVVIFVPMLFEDPGHPKDKAAVELSAPPEPIEQKSIELPKSAADIAQAEQPENKKGQKTAAETGYRVIPLEDAPPPKPPKAEPPPEEAAASVEEPVEETTEASAGEEDFTGTDEGGEPPALGKPGAKQAPIPKAALAEPAKPGKSAKVPPVPKPVEPAAKKPQDKPKSPQQPKPADPVAAKPALKPAATPVAESPAASPKPAAPVPKTPPPETLAKLTPPKPPEPKHSAAPTETPSAWVVQAGSFASESNARGLAERLRKQSIAAYVETIHGGSGVTYRVRVGPELNRGRAEQVQKQIEGAVGIKSLILPRK
ncbi:DedD protein [Methylomagnum ishizawai]|uniref:DedD protein n=1 Tax=Methylomagnum ishizawai TaxID=1760988 RepID=A0A1Y6CY58_9GAMM|nr:SPOR domain-containing protein [Methylomagnum ishizawai]SMF95588.1 DedD protein [Methylomagnum ishizawai]